MGSVNQSNQPIQVSMPYSSILNKPVNPEPNYYCRKGIADPPPPLFQARPKLRFPLRHGCTYISSTKNIHDMCHENKPTEHNEDFVTCTILSLSFLSSFPLLNFLMNCLTSKLQNDFKLFQLNRN